MKIYLGIIGKNSAGKETVYKIIRKLAKSHDLKTSIHHFSDPLKECLAAFYPLSDSKENQQKISTILRQGFGEEILGNAIVHRAKNDFAHIVCLDGIRRPQDAQKLRGLPNSYLVFIDTPFEKRLQHAQSRKDRPAPTEEEFLAQENAEAESKIDEIAYQANIRLDNSSNKKHLKNEVETKIVPLILIKSPLFLK